MTIRTRTCSGCGWVFPESFNGMRCRFCGTYFEECFCPECGELKKPYRIDYPYCTTCFLKRCSENEKYRISRLESYRRKVMLVEKRYEDWLKRIKAVPFVPLSEKEWLEACGYFGGCALCDSTEIEARGYFIVYKEGGRYTSWNILPMCEKCATSLKIQTNPFKRLNPAFNINLPQYRGISAEKLERAVEYLERKLKECEEQKNTSV